MIKDKEIKFILFMGVFLLIVYVFNFGIQQISGGEKKEEGEGVLTISSAVYIVSENGDGTGTISGVPEETGKGDFLNNLTKDNVKQIWKDEQLGDPIRGGDRLIIIDEARTGELIYSIVLGEIHEDYPLTVSSDVYTVSYDGGDTGTISDVQAETSRRDFLRNLRKDDERQIWIEDNLDEIINKNNFLLVRSGGVETQIREITYSIEVNSKPNNYPATISSEIYTINEVNDGNATISGVQPETGKIEFLESLVKDDDRQIWDDKNIHDPVKNEDYLVVTSSDRSEIITYIVVLDKIIIPTERWGMSSETTGASFVTKNNATLNGSITQSGNHQNLTVGFEYGKDTRYGKIIEVGTLETNTSYEAYLNNLTCGNTYHYRTYATLPTVKTKYGEDATFTTAKCEFRKKTIGSFIGSIFRLKQQDNNIATKESALNYKAEGDLVSDIINSEIKTKLTNNSNPDPTSITESIVEVLKSSTLLKMSTNNKIDENVRILQIYLSTHGYYDNLKIDGIFGNQTKQAVINFQRAMDLKTDGIVGPQTKALLK